MVWILQQIAIENAMYYDACHTDTSNNGAGKLACEIDKATVNIGAMFSKQVEGKVSTEVDKYVLSATAACCTHANPCAC